MKKIFVSTLLVVLLFASAGYYFYRSYYTDLVAEAFVSESLPGYVPKRIQNRIKAISIPLNKGTEAMLQRMHNSDITMEQILYVVDNTSEEEAYKLLDEINEKKPQTTNEVFDLAKKHSDPDFDMELFRKPFNDHVTMKQIRNAVYYANQNRKTHDVDFVTGKAILKKLLLQKEKEYQEKAITRK